MDLFRVVGRHCAPGQVWAIFVWTHRAIPTFVSFKQLPKVLLTWSNVHFWHTQSALNSVSAGTNVWLGVLFPKNKAVQVCYIINEMCNNIWGGVNSKKVLLLFFDTVNSSIFAKLILRAHSLGWQGRYTVLLHQVFCIRSSIYAYQMENQKHLHRS